MSALIEIRNRRAKKPCPICGKSKFRNYEERKLHLHECLNAIVSVHANALRQIKIKP